MSEGEASDLIRPWDHKILAQHFRDLKLDARFTVPPKKILDVGFGELRRSSRALREVFPDAEIVAIDNDLSRFERDAPQLLEPEERVHYYFSDIDLLHIPFGSTDEKYDLVVFSMSLFCLPNPLRAIGTIASRVLKNDGLMVITQRNDPVMRALCDLPQSGSKKSKSPTDAVEQHIRQFWKAIYSKAEASQLRLEIPWRFRLVCEHEPLMAFIQDHGFEDVTLNEDGASAIGAYPPSADEILGDVLGTSKKEPQYSRMRWVHKKFVAAEVSWPALSKTLLSASLKLKHMNLVSKIFRLTTHAADVSEHPFRSYNAPLRILPATWGGASSDDELLALGKSRVREWIEGRNLEGAILGFYLLSPSGIRGDNKEPAPQELYPNDGSVKAINLSGRLHDELQLWRFLEEQESSTALIQFYRVSAAPFWDEHTRGSFFLEEGAAPVKMLAFPLLMSGDEDADIESILERLRALKEPLAMRGDADDTQMRRVARYLRSRGEWLKDNKAYAIYYYFRSNPRVDNKPVSRGASLLAKGALPIEATLEFLVMAEEVIGNHQNQRYIHVLGERSRFSERAGRAAILVRNLSHHMGSHVLAHRTLEAAKIHAEGTARNKIGGDKIELRKSDAELIQGLRASAKNLKEDSVFYSYLRERMEFLAMMSLGAMPWALPISLGDFLEFVSGDSSALLRGSIGVSEKVEFVETPKLKQALRDEVVSVPWGTTGLHAFFTIVEGIMRNACKHGNILRGAEELAKARLHVEVEPDEKTDGLWLFCGVPEQQVSAKSAAEAILCKIKASNPQRERPQCGEDPINELNDYFKKAWTAGDIGSPGRLKITTEDGSYVNSALGIIEIAIAAEFLSNAAAPLRVKDVGGKLYAGFMLVRPKDMFGPIHSTEAPATDFSFEYDTYVVAGASGAVGGELPPAPLGPRTLYVGDGPGDSRCAQVDEATWENAGGNGEAAAALILEHRHQAGDFSVVVTGKASWGEWFKKIPRATEQCGVFFAGDMEQLKGIVKGVLEREQGRLLILAHDETALPAELAEELSCPRIKIFEMTESDLFTHLYVRQCLRDGRLGSLRLALFEAAFMKYELFDSRLFEKFGGSPVVALRRDEDIAALMSAKYAKDIIRIVHVSPWNSIFKEKRSMWKRLYPGLLFMTGRGGDVRARSDDWDAPQIDFSTVDKVLGYVGTRSDKLIRLAMLVNRIGCAPPQKRESRP